MISRIMLIVTICLTNAALAYDYVCSEKGPSYATGLAGHFYACETSATYVSQESGTPYVVAAAKAPASEALEGEETGFIKIEERDDCEDSFNDTLTCTKDLQKRVFLHSMLCVMGGFTMLIPMLCTPSDLRYGENWMNNNLRIHQELIEMISKSEKAVIDSKTYTEYLTKLQAIVKNIDQDPAK